MVAVCVCVCVCVCVFDELTVPQHTHIYDTLCRTADCRVWTCNLTLTYRTVQTVWRSVRLFAAGRNMKQKMFYLYVFIYSVKFKKWKYMNFILNSLEMIHRFSRIIKVCVSQKHRWWHRSFMLVCNYFITISNDSSVSGFCRRRQLIGWGGLRTQVFLLDQSATSRKSSLIHRSVSHTHTHWKQERFFTWWTSRWNLGLNWYFLSLFRGTVGVLRWWCVVTVFFSSFSFSLNVFQEWCFCVSCANFTFPSKKWTLLSS